MYFLFRTLSYGAMILSRVLFFALLIMIISIAAPYVPIPKNWIIFEKIVYLGHEMVGLFTVYVPIEYIKKSELGPYIVLFILFLLNQLFKSLDDLFFDKAARIEAENSSNGMNSGNLIRYRRRSGIKLLKDFMHIKSLLESMGRDLAFLAIDVVDSTKMKLNEDQYTVTYSFNKYRSFIEERLSKMNCIKSTWTPDGLMACFEKSSEAIGAAKLILRDLPTFNREVGMQKEFSMRCGVNSGHLFFDESLQLEQITDRVIDIAGHMQKYAEQNSIFMPEMVALAQEDSKEYEKTDIIVDELLVYKWTTKAP